ncbi:MAG: radical SAM protein [Bacillota bacterium]|jgi:histone acetyltransferase (RNA polymerase elongator complex component)|nr:radical SAM protein [Bacillota bacterium]NLV64179.1 radical SAM protein [Clostridiaceae bacterium]
MKRHINIPVFIPHKGCPNNCVFCNQKKISGYTAPPAVNEIKSIIDAYLSTKKPSDSYEIAFFGGSFTGLPFNEQERYLKLAESYVNAGLVDGIRLSTRPDYVDENTLLFLKKFPVKVIELGIQSLDNEVLIRSRRGYTSDEAIIACRRVKHMGFSLGVQVMIGLPADTLEKSVETSKKLINEKPDMARIYPTLVIKGTELESEYALGRYQPLTVSEAVSWCERIIPLYENSGIKVLRIGLQGTNQIRKGGEVLAGPVHPAFGELVYSRIWLNRIIDEIERMKAAMTKSVVIHVPKNSVSAVIGQKRENVDILKKKYGFLSLRVKGDLKGGNPLIEFRD